MLCHGHRWSTGIVRWVRVKRREWGRYAAEELVIKVEFDGGVGGGDDIEDLLYVREELEGGITRWVDLDCFSSDFRTAVVTYSYISSRLRAGREQWSNPQKQQC